MSLPEWPDPFWGTPPPDSVALPGPDPFSDIHSPGLALPAGRVGEQPGGALVLCALLSGPGAQTEGSLG